MGYWLRILLCAQTVWPFGGSPAFADAPADLARLRLQAMVAPYSERAVAPYLSALQAQREALNSSEEGRRQIGEGVKMQLLIAMKAQLDRCFGGDIFRVDAARAMFQAAIRGDAHVDCASWTSSLSDVAAFARDLEARVNSGPQQNRAEILRNTNRDIFIDTAVRAARSDARMVHLITDPPDRITLGDALCGSGLECPEGLKARMNREAEQERTALVQAGHRSLTPEQAADRLRGTRTAMNLQLFRRDLPYHVSQARDPASTERWRRVQERMASGDRPSYEQVANTVGSTLTGGRLPAQVNSDRSRLPEFESQVLANVPEDFYRYQTEMQADPIAQMLSRGNPSWRESLGLGFRPYVLPAIDGSYSVRFDSATGTQERAISADRVKETRDTQFRQLRESARDLKTSVLRPNATEAEMEDTLRKLIIANPTGAGVALLQDPKRISIFCESFKALARQETVQRYVNFGLMAALIGGAVFTGGASLAGAGTAAAIGGVALAGTMVAETANSLWQASNLTEVADLQRAACLGGEAQGSSCQDYESAMRRAQEQYVAAGFSVAGQAGFVRSFAAAARGSVSRLVANSGRIAEAAQSFASNSGRALRSALGDADAAELLAQLATATREQVQRFSARIGAMRPDEIREAADGIRAELRGPAVCAR